MSIVFNGHTVAGAPPPSDTANAAKKADLTSIIATGATNATGATITSGTFFYLNGTLVQALADIASGATFTENTNYEVPSAGSLNALKSAMGRVTLLCSFGKTTGWETAILSDSVSHYQGVYIAPINNAGIVFAGLYMPIGLFVQMNASNKYMSHRGYFLSSSTFVEIDIYNKDAYSLGVYNSSNDLTAYVYGIS